MSVLKDIGFYTESGSENPNKQTHITSYNIPNNVTKLADYCFSECYNLRSITITDSVKSFGEYCFYNCHCLTSITIPDSVTSLGDNCFRCCSNLSSITIPYSVTNLSNNCFCCCTNLSSITIPNSVTSLGDNCFYNCDNLSLIIIPNSVISFGRRCFHGCSNLSSITIPTSVTSLGMSCFHACNRLKTIYTNNPLIKPNYACIPSKCKILPYEQSPDLKQLKEQEPRKEHIEIDEFKIQLPKITEEYKADLLQFNDYIEERTELMETVHTKSVILYHESIIDIAEELNQMVKLKQIELNEYVKVIQNYNTNLAEISSNLTKKIQQHNQKIKEIEDNNYKLPELNTIPKLGQLLQIKLNEDTFEDELVLNENYYYKDDLIIPKTDNPHTEIYKLPCNFEEITLENKRILTKSEKKIALLTIDYKYEYIDLSKSNIQYFIDTFKNCENLKEIKYPKTAEHK